MLCETEQLDSLAGCSLLDFSILYPYRVMDAKCQVFPERVEFHGVSPWIRVFQGFDWFQVKFFRRSELKTILSFVVTLQRQIIPGQRVIFLGFFQAGGGGGIWAVSPLFKATLNNQNFTFISLHGCFA